jgi:hypothetical protein
MVRETICFPWGAYVGGRRYIRGYRHTSQQRSGQFLHCWHVGSGLCGQRTNEQPALLIREGKRVAIALVICPRTCPTG